MFFRDRVDAGNKLAAELQKYRGEAKVILGLPRGGVVCAAPVAESLGLPIDLVFTRKIGHPASPEYAVGAVSENGTIILRCEAALIDKNWLNKEINSQKEEIRRRRHLYLTNRPSVPLLGKTVIIVDDGLATGLTMEAAVESVKKHKPFKIIIAVPVAPYETTSYLKSKVDEVFVLQKIHSFEAVGKYYEYFPQVEDKEITNILEEYNVYSYENF